VLPYYETSILPLVKKGRNVLVAAHGNSLRALVMQLDGLTPDEIVAREIGTGDPLIYEIDESGKVISSEAI